MAKICTKKEYENLLNKVYSEFYTIDEIKKDFKYLIDKGYIKYLKVIETAYKNKRLGSLLRKYDIESFTNDYHKNKKMIHKIN